MTLDEVWERLESLFEKADLRPVEWAGGAVRWLDVTLLPWEEKWRETRIVERLAEAIRRLEIRGAPAIGVAAALGVAMAVHNTGGSTRESLVEAGLRAAEVLRATRPTAYNLFWALERMKRVLQSPGPLSPAELRDRVLEEALRIQAEDIEANIRMGEHGEPLIPDGSTVLTHCNTGALATAGYGTALGVIRTAWRRGKDIRVIATETRPLLQGARLTAWELRREGIPFKLVTDNSVGYLASNDLVDLAIVGADRILTTGHFANKIGTYMIAVLLKRHGKNMYTAAPTSTIDPRSRPGEFKIELRSPEEVTSIMGRLTIAPPGTDALNPAFDVTPPELLDAVVTERGVARPPFEESIPRLLERG